MTWIKQNENSYIHDTAPFSIIKQNEIWYVVDSRDQSKAVPYDDIFNNPVYNIDFSDKTLLAKHFRAEGLNTPGTPGFSFQGDINSGFYRISEDVIGVSIGGIKVAQFDSNGITSNAPYWNIVDQKPNGTGGGNTVLSTWTKRTLNTTIGLNTISGSSLASDIITLPAGTYRINIISIFFGGSVKLRFRNTTDSLTTLIGTSLVSTSAQTSCNTNTLSGIFTINSTKNFELQYYSLNSLVNGLGTPITGSGEPEIYTQIELWKLQ